MRHLLFICLVALILSGCSGLKDVYALRKTEPVISLEKKPCAGKCSVYKILLYDNRQLVYEGAQNVELYGLYTRKLTKSQYNALVKLFIDADYFRFEDDYPSQLLEMPIIVMGFSHEKRSKKISGSINRPKEILQLQRELEKLIQSTEWRLVKAFDVQVTREEAPANEEGESTIIDNQIIIEPASGVFLAQWLRKYPQYDMQLVKKLSPDLNYWVITFSRLKIAPADMLALLKADKELIFAEFNKKVSPR